MKNTMKSTMKSAMKSATTKMHTMSGRAMKRIMIAVAMSFAAGSAQAALPVFSAQCPGGLAVDADRTQTVRVNGAKAALKKFNENYYEAKSGATTISISIEGGVPSVSYTGKNRASGMCTVKSQAKAPATNRESSAARAGMGKFDATGMIPCAQAAGQPMGQCRFGVARDGGGSATLAITLPDGRKRMLFFDKGKATGADLSQADGDMTFKATKEADLYKIRAGRERYEIPEAAVFGG